MALLEPGTLVERRRSFTQEEFDRFAALSGDHNPIHLDAGYAAASRFGRPVAHGMLLYSAICGVAAGAFPDAIHEGQSLMFPGPTYAGVEMTVRLAVTEVSGSTATVTVAITDPAGTPTCTGEMWLRREGP